MRKMLRRMRRLRRACTAVMLQRPLDALMRDDDGSDEMSYYAREADVPAAYLSTTGGPARTACSLPSPYAAQPAASSCARGAAAASRRVARCRGLAPVLVKLAVGR